MDKQFLDSLGLNPAQLKAVRHPPSIPLQILAGPGSGKTKVLTSRIAHLILDHGLSPSSICAVTFTNKAANEMKDRLTKLIGKQRTEQVRLGTFHALCALFLRKFAKLVGIESNFTVCDADESKKIIAALMKPYKEYLEMKDIILKESIVLSHISKAKSKGFTAADLLATKPPKPKREELSLKFTPDDIERIVAEIYKEYERSLRRSNSLDFDDLLVFGVKLFGQHQETVEWCRHILVDEFQDTNIMQYQLMQTIGASSKCVTVVGDPDQSIYAWRSAEVENLDKMRKDFPDTVQIILEQNYRSTGSILCASLAIVAQDKSRIPKSLYTSHPTSSLPVLRSLLSEQAEATYIAVEIKRLMAHMGGILNWGDFVVLLRFNALSRAIESALQKEGIPSRVLGGHKFFERLEIKDLLSYLQLVDNSQFSPGFVRAVNVPSRGIGEKTLNEIFARGTKMKLGQLAVVEQIYDSKIPDIKPPVKRKITSFIKVVRVLRDLAHKRTSPADLIRKLLELIEYYDYLKKTQQDWESRWENVQELINFASEVETQITAASDSADATDINGVSGDTPLRLFLQASMLSSEGDNSTSDEDSKEKVTISTCHAAKGLEWPVVMIPAVEQGTFPFYRTDNVEEERRLLYVACTRAQGLLYLSYSTKRKFGGETKTKELSEFVSTLTKDKQTFFQHQVPEFTDHDRATLSNVLGRAIPNSIEVARRVTEFNRTTRYQTSPVDDVPLSEVQEIDKIPSTSFQTGSGSRIVLPHFPPNGKSSPSYHEQLSTEPILLSQPIHSKTMPPSGRTPIFHMHPLCTLSTHSTLNPSDTSINQTRHPTTPLISTDEANKVIAPLTGVKRRLGMGTGGGGYSNKKFKPPA